MIVLDSCAYIDALNCQPGDKLRQRVSTASLVHVPDGFDIEVLNVLRRLESLGEISSDLAIDEVTVLSSWGRVERHSVVPLLAPMWQLRNNVTGYDAAYIALAARLNLPLITTDTKLARAPQLPCIVEAF